MVRYQILIEYVGTLYKGWQIQKKGKTIKGLIKENLYKFLKSINHFLNREQIAILKIKKKKLDFHSRFSAKQRIYKYIIFNRISAPVINSERGWHIIKKLDLDLMKSGAKKLMGTKDFSTFRASSCNARSPIKTMSSVKVKSIKDRIEIEFQSQSFLQQQVRSMVGCLKYLGEKKWTLKKIEKVLKSKKIMCTACTSGRFILKKSYILIFFLLLIANFLLILHLDSALIM